MDVIQHRRERKLDARDQAFWVIFHVTYNLLHHVYEFMGDQALLDAEQVRTFKCFRRMIADMRAPKKQKSTNSTNAVTESCMSEEEVMEGIRSVSQNLTMDDFCELCAFCDDNELRPMHDHVEPDTFQKSLKIYLGYKIKTSESLKLSLIESYSCLTSLKKQ